MVNLSRVAADTVELYEPMAEEKGVTLQLISHGAPAVMRGDPNLLFAAMANLVDNALKFTPFGGRITIRTFATVRRLGFEVADYGPVSLATSVRLYCCVSIAPRRAAIHREAALDFRACRRGCPAARHDLVHRRCGAWLHGHGCAGWCRPDIGSTDGTRSCRAAQRYRGAMMGADIRPPLARSASAACNRFSCAAGSVCPGVVHDRRLDTPASASPRTLSLIRRTSTIALSPADVSQSVQRADPWHVVVAATAWHAPGCPRDEPPISFPCRAGLPRRPG